ncbi:hypothetical protein MSG28_013819 [Choristoneura fumiferana]|uniref:Uncharacterized protein n=1 Tax=Choristoneura fumiferana TaxID=7141 RepID=A0ACC0KA58_CHOFU|nr:hypothetical protein MSG28_013819 [Choristoneura fumiferana]
MEAEISRHSENEVTENLNAFPSDFGSSASSSQTLSCEMEAEDLIESNDEVTQTLDARVNPPLDISAALLEDFGQSRSTNLTLSCKMEAEALRELKDEVSETLAARVFNPSLNVSAAALPADFGPSTSTSQKFPYTMEAEALIESKDNITEYRCAHAFNSSMDVSTTFGRDLEPPESSSQIDPENGSWFIQKLCEKIKEYGLKHDLETIFRMVRRTVALDCDTEKDWKQMPVVTSTTLRELYLAPNLQQEDEQPRPASPYVLVCPTSDSDVYPVSHQLAERLNEHVSFSRHNKKDPVAKSLLKLVERTGSGSEYNLQKFDYIQSMWEHFEANKDSFPPDGFSFVHRMHMPLNEPETERTPTELDNFEYQSMSRKNKMTERTPSKDEENEITETIDILEWTQTLSLTSTVTRHIYLKNKKAEESFPPDEEDDEDIENNSISYTPVTNSQNSKNDCTVASPQSSFMNGGIQRGSTFESLPATYELDKFQKNAMVIFNHEKYAQRDVSPRIGTEYDKNALKKTFQRFRFEVTTYDDLSKEELLSKLTECLSRQNTGQFCYVGFHGKGIGFNFFVDVFPHAASVVDRDAGRRFCAATSLDGKKQEQGMECGRNVCARIKESSGVSSLVFGTLGSLGGFLLTVLDFVLLSYYDYSYTAASARNETIVELSERPEVIPQTLWYALAVFLFLAYTLASAAVGLALPHHEVTAFYGIVTLSVLAHIHYGACVVPLIEKLHRLHDVTFLISYTDPRDGDLLPINNDDNLARALLTARPLLRELNGYGTMRHRNFISSILSGTPAKNKGLAISNPHDFRMVSAIIDVDIVPETCRRVKLLKHGSDRPLGFFIRDGTSVRVTPNGVERSPGIFISRLVPGGLAESTGLLGVNDEVLEVNGIDVSNKTLDQVTDMMVANSSNLIITVRPANQRAGPPPDEIVDLTAVTLEDQPEPAFQVPSKDDGQVLHL